MIRKPLWLLLSVTLPQFILLWLFYATYQIIETRLQPEHIAIWKILMAWLSTMCVGFTAYAVVQAVRRLPLNAWVSALLLLGYIAYLWYYFVQIDHFIPRSIPVWMLVRGDVDIYGYTFVMPAIIYAMFILIDMITPNKRMKDAGISFGMAISIPVGWFVLIQLASATRLYFDIFQSLIMLLAIGSVMAFLVLLLRGLYILLHNRTAMLYHNSLIWKIPVCIIFPILGLAVNSSENFFFIFGDFSSPWFYAIALVNGIILCLPRPDGKGLRLAMFTATAAGFAYITYFFLVFLPFLPLSIAAIIVVGAGFLMLAPLLIFFLQAYTLYQDFQYLKQQFSPLLLTGMAVLGYSILPAVLVSNYYADRLALHQAMDYIYQHNYDEADASVAINTRRVKDVIQRVMADRNDFSRGEFGGGGKNHQPYLHSLYVWLVLDNLTLSTEKTEMLEKVFDLDIKHRERPFTRTVMPSNANVTIAGNKTTTRYDSTAKCYRTWIDLDLKNSSNFNQEFTGNIILSDSTFISNYYLDMAGRREYGILAEKRAAMWVYNNIVSTRRDPGILYYTSANNVHIGVFPVDAEKGATTGIEIIHAKPQLNVSYQGNNIYVDKNDTAVDSKPNYYCHFIVDYSADAKITPQQAQAAISRTLQTLPGKEATAMVSIANYRAKTYPLSEWTKHEDELAHEAGLYTDAVMRAALKKQYASKGNAVPVFIIVSDGNEQIVRNDIADLAFAQATTYSYRVNSRGASYAYNTATGVEDSTMNDLPAHINEHLHAISASPSTQASYVQALENVDKQNAYTSALMMQEAYRHLLFNPQETDELWMPILKESFRHNTLTPITSFLALEDEAQKQVLKAKQEQILNSKTYIDAGDEIQRMSEPPLWLLAAIAGGLAYIWGRRKTVAV